MYFGSLAGFVPIRSASSWAPVIQFIRLHSIIFGRSRDASAA
jgi:hypothetical protein